MAIAFVQKAGTETTSTANDTAITLTTNVTVASGHLLVGFYAGRNLNGAIVSSVSDNGAGGSLSWSVAVSNADTTNKYGTSIFYAQAPSGLASGTVITITLNAAETRKVMGVYDFSGAATSSVTGVTTTAGASTGNPALTLSSAATANDLVVMAFVHAVTTASETITEAGSMSILGTAVAGSSSRGEGHAQYLIDATGTADVGGYTPGTDTTTRWNGCACCFHYNAAASYVDSGTIALTITPSGTDGLDSVDAGTVALTTALAGTDTAQFLDAGTIAVPVAISGDDVIAAGVSGQTVLQNRRHNVVRSG